MTINNQCCITHSEPDRFLLLAFRNNYDKHNMDILLKVKKVRLLIIPTSTALPLALKGRSHQHWSLEECSASIVRSLYKPQPSCVADIESLSWSLNDQKKAAMRRILTSPLTFAPM